MNDQQKLAIRDLLQALLDAVKAHGDSSAPSGQLYATVMGVRRLDQYEQLIEALVALRWHQARSVPLALSRSGFAFACVRGGAQQKRSSP
jgi:hypothetical protein